jgi:hypothetical protein
MNRQVERLVRSLDVKAAQEHMRRTTGNPFVAAPSEVNGRMYSGDENALIALHKMPTRMGSPADRGQQCLAAVARIDRAL